MARPTPEDQLASAVMPILAHFSDIEKTVFSTSELRKILATQREHWGLKRVSFPRFLNFLLTTRNLHEERLQAKGYRSIRRYIWGQASDYDVAKSFRPRSYFSHGTAVLLHGLNNQIPNTIYLNHEQSAKPRPSGRLTQERVDFAFRREQRTSSYVYQRGKTRIVLLNGKHTGQLGVEPMVLAPKSTISVTNIDRTLIDIVVRPAYSGGIFQVLEAYRSARDIVSVEAVHRMLDELDYVYPYHQPIGFLLERAGIPSRELQVFRRKKLELDFYLTPGMKEPKYDKSWRLFIPEGI